MGMSALGKSRGLLLKGSREAPAPHKIKVWKPVAGILACGILRVLTVLPEHPTGADLQAVRVLEHNGDRGMLA